ncbi:MAG: DNA-processing protein DprA [Pseudomonadota bacterium]
MPLRDPEEYISWLSLKSVPGIGNRTFKRLLIHCGSPENVFATPIEELVERRLVSQIVAAGIVKLKDSAWAREEIKEVKRRGLRLVSFADDAYPHYLRCIPDPPPVLYVHGTLSPAGQASIAIVGTRNPTQYGLDMTKELASGLAKQGFLIVSGMARGIDTAAHKWTLESSGKTLAVLGCGLGTVYPAENKALFHRIGETGAVVSEFPVAASPEPHHFPIRNRVISGISLGSIVVEASAKSGSLITAQYALEQGRTVFSVPGSVRSVKSAGTHKLIKQGGVLIERVEDVLMELEPLASRKSLVFEANNEPAERIRHDLSHFEREALNLLAPYPMHIDAIIRNLSLDAGQVLGILLQLEIKGLVEQTPGKYFARAQFE